MQIACERHEDLELKELYDAGMDVSWAGETITFSDDAQTLVFRLDDSLPGEAQLSKLIENGRSLAVKLGKAFAGNEIALPRTNSLLVQALEFLRDERTVRGI
ncbi:hypothetical protein [Dyella tabacisoli]|uniref:Uncharacterized protein n=1 Tax=Dyella tabacisoli TaxID=2282381 RepID=A0A369UHK5_9GAMM|nr:hypothetical protein [Dyella tabacisoli]RDD80051.1 hypothetical protein DVJ77_19460 [Dyella tabacisoli]